MFLFSEYVNAGAKGQMAFFLEWLASTCPAIHTQPFSMVFCGIMHVGLFISFDNMVMPYFSQNRKNRKITGYQ